MSKLNTVNNLSNVIDSQYNNQNWQIHCSLLNLNTNLQMNLLTTNLLYLQITNSIEYPVPQLILRYNDTSFLILQNLRINGTKLTIWINPPAEYNMFYTGEYILSNIKVDEQKKDYALLTFYFKHIDILKLLKNVNYSTNKQTLDGQVSPYKIIEDINKKINNPFDKIYEDTTKKIDFISSQNSTALEIIKYCLRMGADNKNLPSYFFKHILDGKSELFNQYSIIKNENKNKNNKNNNKNLVVNTQKEYQSLDIQKQLTNIITHNFLGGEKNLEKLASIDLNDFSHDSRKWLKTTYNNKQFISLLSNTLKSKTDENLFYSYKDICITDYYNSYPNYSHSKIYNVLRNLQLGTQNLQFKILGNFLRDAGQILTFNASQKSAKPFFAGKWIIYSCNHIWQNASYVNNITCYRTLGEIPINTTKD